MSKPQQVRTAISTDDEELVRRAVKFAIRTGRKRDANWVRVMGVFSIGSTAAAEVCARFGFNPSRCGVPSPSPSDKGGET